jgi:hypothetical protein
LVIEEAAENVLTRRLLQVPEFYEFFIQELARANELADSILPSELDRMYDQIADTARTEPLKQCETEGIQHPCGAPEFEASVEFLRAFLQNRSAAIAQQMAPLQQQIGAQR